VLNPLTTDRVKISPEPPLRRQAGDDFDDAVDAEADECHAARDNPRSQRDDGFEDVVADGEVVEPKSSADQRGRVAVILLT
jgi:hypothetical protein